MNIEFESPLRISAVRDLYRCTLNPGANHLLRGTRLVSRSSGVTTHQVSPEKIVLPEETSIADILRQSGKRIARTIEEIIVSVAAMYEGEQFWPTQTVYSFVGGRNLAIQITPREGLFHIELVERDKLVALNGNLYLILFG